MDRNVRDGINRLLLVLATSWVAAWAYVGWRAYGLRQGALNYAASLPPGTAVPADVSAVLEVSTAWLRNAVLLGGILPCGLLAGAWLYRRFVLRGEQSESGR